MNYLFVNHNNGHVTTYHPFVSSIFLSQERVTKWLLDIPDATRCGTTLTDLLYRLEKEKIPFEEFKCPCCGKIVNSLPIYDRVVWDIAGIEWILLEGVSGNY